MSSLINLEDAHFWVTIALLVFIVILWRAKVPGLVTGALDAAGRKVQDQLDEAARLRAEAAEVLADIRRQREETEKAAAEMLESARLEAERLRLEAARRLEEDIARRGVLAERRIAAAEAKAAAEVKAAAVDLAAETAVAVLAARLAAEDRDPLIDAALADLPTRFSATAN